MWVLILVLYTGGVDSIEGFSSKEACTVAGEKVKRTVDGAWDNLDFICIEKR